MLDIFSGLAIGIGKIFEIPAARKRAHEQINLARELSAKELAQQKELTLESIFQQGQDALGIRKATTEAEEARAESDQKKLGILVLVAAAGFLVWYLLLRKGA